MSSFDPATFLEQTVDEPLSTQMQPIPEGEYTAVISMFGEQTPIRKVDTKFGPRYILSLSWEIQDEEVKKSLGRDKVTVKQDLWLDVDEAGRLLSGGDNNWRLGQVRAAVGQNAPGPWSPRKLGGAGPAKIKVFHRSDEKDPQIKYSEVSRVAALA